MTIKYFDLEGLEEMASDEVEYIKSRVVQIFGRFHNKVVIQGVYFYHQRSPVTVYPEPYSQYSVAVLLPQHQADNPIARLINLSHELVHCLTPNGPPSEQATVLEEGLAEHAQVYLVREHFQDQFPEHDFLPPLGDDYRAAFDHVEHLVMCEGLETMRQSIRRLREDTELPFAQICEQDLKPYFSKSPDQLLSALSVRFRR